MADVPAGAADRARALFGNFIEGRWEETRGEFHENIRGRLDAGRIAHGWAHMASSAGGFERVGESFARQFGEYIVVEIRWKVWGAGSVSPGHAAVADCPRRRWPGQLAGQKVGCLKSSAACARLTATLCCYPSPRSFASRSPS
jgi:hypothetical protein